MPSKEERLSSSLQIHLLGREGATWASSPQLQLHFMLTPCLLRYASVQFCLIWVLSLSLQLSLYFNDS